MSAMQRYLYAIADIMFDITADGRFSAARRREFIVGSGVTGPRASGRSIRVECEIGDIESGSTDNGPGQGIRYQMVGDRFKAVMYEPNGTEAHIMSFDESLRSFRVVSAFPQALPFEGSVGEVLFRTAILNSDGIVVHSSGIECGGSGIVFSAPSGTGKSTQASMWKIAKSAVVLNGDRAAIRFMDDAPYVYGTPWAGSSRASTNRKAPLRAIIILEQHCENELLPLSMAEALRRLMPRCYLPLGQPRLLDLAISNLDRILRSVPVYLLRNRRGFEAVDLVADRLGL